MAAVRTTSKGQAVPSSQVTLVAYHVTDYGWYYKTDMKYLSIDCSCDIGQPRTRRDELLALPLGLWRMDHVDISTCPQLASGVESRPGLECTACSKLVKMTDLGISGRSWFQLFDVV
jgi:hypothetical protein